MWSAGMEICHLGWMLISMGFEGVLGVLLGRGIMWFIVQVVLPLEALGIDEVRAGWRGPL